MDVLYWLVSAAALLAVWLNIHRHVACFYIWAGTNATWAVVDYAHGIHAQATLQVVYFALSLWGIRSWTRRKTPGLRP